MNAVLATEKQNMARRIVIWTMLGNIIFASSCFACGGILDVACNLQNGGLSPGNISNQVNKAGQGLGNALTKAGQDVGNAINELQANVLSGPTLEQAIIASRNTAINGSLPIPPNIRQKLTGYASEDSMNRARYKIGDNGFLNLARLLEQGGFAGAVTLIDVIVFRDQSEADRLDTWAHELTHVDQYADGTHSFAVRYARNYRSIEDPAYAKGDGWQAWYAQQHIAQPLPQIPQQIGAPNGWPSGFGTAQCGCWGATTGVNPDGRCQSGMVVAVACTGICPYGGSPYGWVCQ